MQGFIGVERANQPIDAVGGSGQAQFLAEGAEFGEHLVLAGFAIEDVGRAIVEIQAVDRLPIAQRSDRGQHRMV